MPRLGAVWKLNDKTVVRGGYGLFYDTNNVLVANAGVDQSGFSRGTGRTLTNNNGLTFLDANLAAGRTILHDPFPVREDGTRFNEPFGNALGISAKAGRGFDYEGYDWKRAKQQRWRVGVQREISRTMVAEAAYLGSYANGISIGDPWRSHQCAAGRNSGRRATRATTRTPTISNALVPNPFNIANFEFLRTQDPVLYQDMAANGFFTATTIRRHQLLRALPHMTAGDGLRNTHSGLGETKYHHLELSLQKRLSSGYEFTVGYTRAWHRDRDIFDNEFDERPIWRPEQRFAAAPSARHRHRRTAVRRRQALALHLAHRPRAARRMAGVRHLSPAERPLHRLGQSLLLRRQLRGHRAAAQRTRSRALVQHRRLRARERASARVVPHARVPAPARFRDAATT